jgi:hypothetical protein
MVEGIVKKPFFLLEANGALVDLELGKDIKSITFNDKEGINSDKIAITIINPDYKKPAKGDELVLYFGYDGVPLMLCGLFKVDGSTRKDNRVLIVKGTAVDFKSPIKKGKSVSYENTTVKDIVSLKAKEHGLEVKSDVDVNIPFLTQTNQNDLDFLKKLADEYNAIFAVKNKTLVFTKKNKAGELNPDVPTFEYDAEKVTNLSINETSKKENKSCECVYHDYKLNKEVKVVVGDGTPILHYSGNFKDEAEAKIKAEAKLEKSNEGIIQGFFTNEGDVIYAGANLVLTNTIHGENDGNYNIKTVNHRMTSEGWTIDVEFQR